VAVELSSKLPSGHVEVRLAGQEPELVFVEAAGESAGAGEELTARISLRLPESLKTAVEKAAAREGVSTNAWLVRAIARAAESRPAHVGGKRLSGYARS
jgi:predicted HicB family RNase H-like nuclease